MNLLKSLNQFLSDIKIKTKFILSFALVLIISIPILSYVFISQSEGQLRAALESKVNVINKNFSMVAENALGENQYLFMQSLISGVAAQDKDLQLMLIANAQSTIVASSSEDEYRTLSKISDPQILSMVDQGKDQVVYYDKEDALISISFIRQKPDLGEEGMAPDEENAASPEGDSELLGYIFLKMSTKALADAVQRLWIYSGILTFVFLMLGIGLAYYLGMRLSNPIEHLARRVRQIADGNFSVAMFSDSKDEIGQLISDVDIMRRSIKDLTENLEEKVRQRTQELNEANKQLSEAMDALWGEMELAKKIQMALLPEDPKITNYDIVASMTPADEVGGDYYDVIEHNGCYWLVIGDVSGHGVPAGLIMMMVQTAIQTVVHENPNMSPPELLDVVNRTITSNIRKLGENKYMTITVFMLRDNGEFNFSGLHQDIYIYRQSTGKVEVTETHGMWLGLVDEVKEMNDLRSVKLDTGDVMLLYTDGVTEAVDENNRMLGDKKLMDIFKRNGKKKSEKIKEAILNALKPYRKPDDVTMMVIKRVA